MNAEAEVLIEERLCLFLLIMPSPDGNVFLFGGPAA